MEHKPIYKTFWLQNCSSEKEEQVAAVFNKMADEGYLYTTQAADDNGRTIFVFENLQALAEKL